MTTVLQKYLADLRSCIASLHPRKSKLGSQKYDKKRTEALLLFVLIKKLSRIVKYDVTDARASLHQEKFLVENNRLQLQNLLYEVNHLNREIKRCYHFKSQDEDIDLLSVSEYTNLLKINYIPTESHEKRLSLLEWELNYRKELSEKSTELLRCKKNLFEAIIQKTERLTSILPSLQSLLESTKPLQESLGTTLCTKWRLGKLVSLLPPPLYLVYVNCFAIEEIVDLKIDVSIVGVENDAYENAIDNQFKRGWQELRELCEKAMNLLEEPKNNAEGNQFLQPFPLLLKIGIDETNCACCNLYIRWFQRLDFCTAFIDFHCTDKSLSELFFFGDMLQYLYENDTGAEIPIRSINMKAKKCTMSSNQLLDYMEKNNFGRPYRWLNRLCGIETTHIDRDCNMSIKNLIAEALTKIKNYWKSRLLLFKQVKSLIEKDFEQYILNENLPFVKPSCNFLQWTSITFEEIQSKCNNKTYFENHLVEKENIFYRAVIIRGSAKMECLISISKDFPSESPLWIIYISWNGEHNSRNNTAIKMMEYLTNTISEDEFNNEMCMLPLQLIRTMLSFDIFLETEGQYYTPQEYNKEHNYIRAFSKRFRCRPYRYTTHGNCCIFRQ